MSWTAIGSGAVGAVVAAALLQLGRACAAWRDIPVTDAKVRERTDQLFVWVDDRTQLLARELSGITEEANRSCRLESSVHARTRADAKALALHQYRDREWQAGLDIAELLATEGAWHRLWRVLRRRKAPTLSPSVVAPFLGRWREPAKVPGSGITADVLDRTKRTEADALAELDKLTLT
jgi:hypothetical protein